MRISSVEVIVLQFPPARVVEDAIHRFGDDRGGVAVKLTADDGTEGWGYTFLGMGARGAGRALKAILEGMVAPAVEGADPHAVRAIRHDIWRAIEYSGWSGLVHMGVAAVDSAIYDLITRAAGLPAWKWFGGARDRIPAYAMVGWYYEDDDGFRGACADAIAEGFSDVKIKVGLGSLDEDIHRIRLAREVVGQGRVMVDANQKFGATEALVRGRAYQDEGIWWYEEPMIPEEIDGYAMLASELDVAIATGENLFGLEPVRRYLDAKAVDILQPDNRRAGGPTDWLAIGALAEAHRVPIASHGGGPGNVHLLCCLPTAIYLETGSIKEQDFFVEELVMEDGCVLAPESPGMGNEIRPHVIEKHRVA